MSVNYYDLLGLSRTADSAAVERAYRTFSKAYHPDTGSPTANSALFREVTEARDTLTDPDRRSLYDWQLEELSPPRPSATTSGQANYASRRSQGNDVVRARGYFSTRSPQLLLLAVLAFAIVRWCDSFGPQPPFALISDAGRLSSLCAAYSFIAYLVLSKSKVRIAFRALRRFVSSGRARVGPKSNAADPRE